MEMKDASIGALNEELRDSRSVIKKAVQEEVGEAIRHLSTVEVSETRCIVI